MNTLKGEQNQPEHLARNAFGALPTLELDDGRFIVESLAIIYFLEDLFPEGALQPSEPVAGAGQRHGAQYRNPLCQQFGSLRACSELALGLPKDPKVASEIGGYAKGMTYIENILSMVAPCLGR